MSGGVKVQISLTAAGDVDFNVLQRSALGGSKPLWRFQISQDDARPLHAQLGQILNGTATAENGEGNASQ
jgi:hypothetical protein